MRLRLIRFSEDFELSDEWVVDSSWLSDDEKEVICLLSDTRHHTQKDSAIGFHTPDADEE